MFLSIFRFDRLLINIIFITFFSISLFSSFSVAGKEVEFTKETLALPLVAVQSDLTPDLKQEWQKIREKVANGVAQIIVQVSEFNWEEPYKSPCQYESFGSGFFIDKEGYFVTNYHVIEEASRQPGAIQIQIPIFGKKRFDLEVVGVNPERDIALLKLKKEAFDLIVSKLKEIPALTLGDSDKMRSITDIVVIGYPLGQEKLKVTKGIVSGREFMSEEPYLGGDSYFQIDAAINLGNSGGPAFNLLGEVIGISTSYYSDAQNVGYIIPINDVKNVIDELKRVKLQYKPFLGAEFGNVNIDMLKSLGNPVDGGWFITKVFKDSPFAKNGIEKGDVLYQVNDYKVDMFGEIRVDWSDTKVSIFDLFNRLSVGQELNFVFYRNGKKIDLHFNLEASKPLPIRVIYPEYQKVDFEIIGGMVVMELALNHIEPLSKYNPYLVNYINRDNQYENRLVISHIVPNSQLQRSRTLEKGEILDEINGFKVRTISDFRKAVLESSKSGFLSIKADNDNFVILSVAKILKDEDLLANEYVYEKTNLTKELYRLYKLNKK